jgi:hypothetical protein
MQHMARQKLTDEQFENISEDIALAVAGMHALKRVPSRTRTLSPDARSIVFRHACMCFRCTRTQASTRAHTLTHQASLLHTINQPFIVLTETKFKQ